MSVQNFFPWKVSYETGIEQIDEQHKMLVKYINELYDAALKSETSDITKTILKKLNDYVETHFRDEEKLMSVAKYEKLEEHKAEHTAFENKIKEYNEDISKGFPVTFQLLNFLREWLLDHILVTDKQYVPFV